MSHVIHDTLEPRRLLSFTAIGPEPVVPGSSGAGVADVAMAEAGSVLAHSFDGAGHSRAKECSVASYGDEASVYKAQIAATPHGTGAVVGDDYSDEVVDTADIERISTSAFLSYANLADVGITS